MVGAAHQYSYFNPGFIADLTDNDKDVTAGIIHDFLELSPEYFRELENVIQTPNPTKINFAAHKLTGSFNYIGATQLAKNAEKIERISKTQPETKLVQELFVQLKKQYYMVLDELNDYLKFN